LNFDPALLDELGRVFVEAAMRRIQSETAEIEVVEGSGDGHGAHLNRNGPVATYEKNIEVDDN
jgi:hypothetical protein